jgi:hypothetical protein
MLCTTNEAFESRFEMITSTTHVRRNRMEACLGKRLQLVPPRVPRLREPVTQHDQWASTRFRQVHANAVGLNEAMPDLVDGAHLACSESL